MQREFEYGPVSQGIFLALVCVTPLLLFINPAYMAPYLLFLLFLGLCLRPLLVWTGLHKLWSSTGADIQQGMDRKFVERRRAEIDVQAKLKRFRQSRYRDPRLPRNW